MSRPLLSKYASAPLLFYPLQFIVNYILLFCQVWKNLLPKLFIENICITSILLFCSLHATVDWLWQLADDILYWVVLQI